MNGLRRLLLIASAIALAMWLVAPGSAADPAPTTGKPIAQTEEDRLGDKAAAELEKQMKVVADSPEIPRLERIANEIGPWTERPKIRYTVKVLDSKAVNAVSIPGGRLYVTQGILKAVESDDELAAVLAHEIAHNSLKHAMTAQKRAARGNLGVMAAIFAGIASGRGEIPMIAAQIEEGSLNHYGREAELQADRRGLAYLTHTTYRPVAMLTVLEGLAEMEVSRGRSSDASTSTHPLARDRVRAVKTQLEKMGVNIAADRRLVTARFKIETASAQESGAESAQLLLNGKVVFSVTQADGAQLPLQRVQAFADSLSSALRRGLQLMDLKVTQQDHGAAVIGLDTVIIKVTAADASSSKRDALLLAQDAHKVIALELYAEKLTRPF